MWNTGLYKISENCDEHNPAPERNFQRPGSKTGSQRGETGEEDKKTPGLMDLTLTNDEDEEAPMVADSTQTADKDEKEDCTRDMT